MKKILLFALLTYSICCDAQNASNSFSTMTGMNPKPELFDDINFGGFDLVSANFKYSKDNTLQKVVLSPFKLLKDKNIFSDIKVNLAQKDDISTFGAAFGFDNTNPFNSLSGRVDRKLGAMPARTPKREQNVGETNAAYQTYLQGYMDEANGDRINYFRSLAKGAFSFTLGYNYSAFGILSGTDVKNTSGLITNKYVNKGQAWSIDVNYSFNQDFLVNGGLSSIRKRKSALENDKMVRYSGANFAASYRVIYLQSKKDLIRNAEYVKSFFIPSVLLGLSVETLRAHGDELFYEDGYRYQRTIMPFLDFKITPTNQFRIGIPVKKYEKVTTDQTSLGPFIQYSLTLANKS